MKKTVIFIFTFLKRVLAITGTSIAIYILFAVVSSFLPTHPPVHDCISMHKIFISGNGVHLDIIIPAEKLEHQIQKNIKIVPGTKFIAFGWGDKQFYINTPEWSDLKLSVAFKALFLKTESAMHVTCLPYEQNGWQKLKLCEWQFEKLNRYIDNSFKKTNDSKKYNEIKFGGYSDYDFFYEAKKSFSLFETCNSWVNRALKKIEIKTSVWSPFDFSVLYHLKKIDKSYNESVSNQKQHHE